MERLKELVDTASSGALAGAQFLGHEGGVEPNSSHSTRHRMKRDPNSLTPISRWFTMLCRIREPLSVDVPHDGGHRIHTVVLTLGLG